MERKYREVKAKSSKRLLAQLTDADSFSLVQGLVPRGESTTLPPPKDRLQPYLLSTERVCEWPGTEIKADEDWEAAIAHTYRVCPESLAILAQYPTFTDFEEDMDIYFTKNGTVILYTTGHEGLVYMMRG